MRDTHRSNVRHLHVVPAPGEKQRGRPKKSQIKTPALESFEFYAHAIKGCDPKLQTKAKEVTRLTAQAITDPNRLTRSSLVVLNLILDQGSSLWRDGCCRLSNRQIGRLGHIAERSAIRGMRGLVDAGLVLKADRVYLADGSCEVSKITVPILAREIAKLTGGVLSENHGGTVKELCATNEQFPDSTVTGDRGGTVTGDTHTYQEPIEKIDRQTDQSRNEIVCATSSEVIQPETEQLTEATADIDWAVAVSGLADIWGRWTNADISEVKASSRLQGLVGSRGGEAARVAVMAAISRVSDFLDDGKVKTRTNAAFGNYFSKAYRECLATARHDLAIQRKAIEDIAAGKEPASRSLAPPPRAHVPSGKYTTNAAGRKIFSPNTRVWSNYGVSVVGEQVNDLIEQFEFVTVDDIERADPGKATTSGIAADKIKSTAFYVAAQRQYGTPTDLCGGPVAKIDGEELSIGLVCISQATLADAQSKYPNAKRVDAFDIKSAMHAALSKAGQFAYGPELQASAEAAVDDLFRRGERRGAWTEEVERKWKELAPDWDTWVIQRAEYVSPAGGNSWRCWMEWLAKRDPYLREQAETTGWIVIDPYEGLFSSFPRMPILDAPPKGWDRFPEDDDEGAAKDYNRVPRNVHRYAPCRST